MHVLVVNLVGSGSGSGSGPIQSLWIRSGSGSARIQHLWIRPDPKILDLMHPTDVYSLQNRDRDTENTEIYKEIRRTQRT